MRDEHPPQRAPDRIETEKCLIGKTGQCKQRLREVLRRRAFNGNEMLSEHHLDRLVQQIRKLCTEGGQQEDSDHCRGPEPRGRQHGPSQEQQQCHRGRDKAAPQIVKEFPLRQPGKGIAFAASVLSSHTPPQPTDKLPVAAYPAMAASDVRAVPRGELLVEFHIANQSGAGVATFQEVVAQDSVFGEATFERPLECVDVVDPLADERAFAKYVLVDVRHSPCIRVETRYTPEQARIARPARAGQTCGHAGLQDAVPSRHDVAARARSGFIKASPIQWMRHGTDKLPRGVTRQLRVRIEGDDVLHLRQNGRRAHDERKTSPVVAA